MYKGILSIIFDDTWCNNDIEGHNNTTILTSRWDSRLCIFASRRIFKNCDLWSKVIKYLENSSRKYWEEKQHFLLGFNRLFLFLATDPNSSILFYNCHFSINAPPFWLFHWSSAWRTMWHTIQKGTGRKIVLLLQWEIIRLVKGHMFF